MALFPLLPASAPAGVVPFNHNTSPKNGECRPKRPISSSQKNINIIFFNIKCDIIFVIKQRNYLWDHLLLIRF